MNRPAMKTGDRRAITLGAAVLVPSLLFVYGVQPYQRSLTALRAQVNDERALLDRDRASAAALTRLPAAQETQSRQLGAEGARLFGGENDLAATGALAEYVAAAATTNGIQIQQLETRPAHALAPGVRAVQVEVRAEGDLAGILPFLHALERGAKLVRVGRLAVERRDGAVDTTKLGNVEVLSLSASVYGYRLTTPLPGPSTGSGVGASSPFVRVAYDLPAVAAVIDRDPFNPARTRPSPSYQTALGGSSGGGQGGGPADRLGRGISLVGTVVSGSGQSFAMCQTGNDVPHVVRVGEQIAGYTLSAIDRGRAVFRTSNGGRLELRVPQLGSGS